MASEESGKATPSLASRITRDPPTESIPQTESSSNGGAGNSQADGAPASMGGSGLQEPEYEVEIKLADMQADPNNPLYSVKSFDELNL
jgi:ATP-dependent RNA helicase DDX19/DBP5